MPTTDPRAMPPRSVLARGLLLLDALGGADRPLTLAELAARSGLPKPTALRMLRELVGWGGVELTTTGSYRLGLHMFALGQRAPRLRALRDAAMPFLEHLHEETQENVHLAVREGTDTLFLEKLTGYRATPIISRVGGRLPVHCTATGKVFLAMGSPDGLRDAVEAGLVRRTPRTIVLAGLLRRDLDRTRGRGFAVNIEESEVGVVAVAAPVFGDDEQVVASISVTGGPHRIGIDRAASRVCAMAEALTSRLRRRAAGEP